jgi:hypothetical protein
MVIALLDGCQADDGSAWEIGYFYSKKSPEQKIIGAELRGWLAIILFTLALLLFEPMTALKIKERSTSGATI